MKLSVGFSRLRVLGGLGAFEHEKGAQREYFVSLALTYKARKAIELDSLDLALDYSEVADLVLKLVASRHYDLIETIASEIFRAIKAKFKVKELEVLVEKPLPSDAIERSFVRIGTKKILI